MRFPSMSKALVWGPFLSHLFQLKDSQRLDSLDRKESASSGCQESAAS